MFDFFEKSDPAKAEAGEGAFSVVETALKNFASDVAPTETKDSTGKTKEKDNLKAKGWKSLSKTNKATIIGSGVLVFGLAIWYFAIRKK